MARRIVIPGGSGQVGTILARHFVARGDDVTVLSRYPHAAPWNVVRWDAATPGDWVQYVDGADVVINLAGRSVNCRYSARNRAEIYNSRIAATRLLNRVLADLPEPPGVWLNASTATIYRHALDRDMDETTGEFGGGEPGAPEMWNFSIKVARDWESAFFETQTPRTRKVALRSAMTMSPDPGGVFDVLSRLVRLTLGGKAGSGRQYVSWIHEADFVRGVELLIANDSWTGAVNLASPQPLPNREFMRELREAWGVPNGIPAAKWMVELGAIFMRTESELVLKSRRVVPGRLLDAGFEFQFPGWDAAARDLVQRMRSAQR